jgi:protein-tyrosine-phosphatase
MTATLMVKHKIPISCTARKVTTHDFSKFDYIIAMDQSKYIPLLARQVTG